MPWGQPEQVAAGLGPLLADATAVVWLQNGVDNEEKLAQHAET